MQAKTLGGSGAWLLSILLIAVAPPAAAQKAAPETIPPVLRPWQGWALHGHASERCPFFHDLEDSRCAWPSRLKLALGPRGGQFEQEWVLHTSALVTLPGDGKRWPSSVRVDGRPAAVVEHDGMPELWLASGRHRISGQLLWDSLPESIAVPPSTGLLALSIAGKPVLVPRRDESGRVWLHPGGISSAEPERLSIIVHRKVVDGVPLQLHTRLELRVSGKSREVRLGRALLPGFVPTALEGDLPARLDPDGHLRVQVRPGTWVLMLKARHRGPVTQLKLPAPDGPWDADEVWVFEARSALRIVSVEDVPAVDPEQTALPPEWKSLPAFRLVPGNTMRLQQRRRGDSDPPPDRLRLTRTLWLDFDGAGFTIADNLDGTLRRSWRLQMQRETKLGRVAVGGRNVLITQTGPKRLPGVELRQGNVSIEAESRFTAGHANIPAVGWSHDVEALSASLNLPPGWRLLHALGADRAPGSWVEHWNLLDLFLLLVLSLATARLFGWRVGALALLTLLLTLPEPDAPRWIWAGLLAFEALRRVLPEGRLRRIAALGRLVVAIALLLIAIPFAMHQIRTALYPGLELAQASGGFADGLMARALPQSPPVGRTGATGAGLPEPEVERKPTEPAQQAQELRESSAKRLLAKVPARHKQRRQLAAKLGYGKLSSQLSSSTLAQIDPGAAVQTGPGVPTWRWRTQALYWSGPVRHDQRLRLLLSPPWLNAVLNVTRALCLAALLLILAGWTPRRPRIGRGATAAVVAAAALIVLAPHAANAQIPTDEMLEQLRTRLLEPPACYPRCASCSQMELEVTARALRARLQLAASAPTAVPLPGSDGQWLPHRVQVDGHPAAELGRRDGHLWLRLEPGVHRVEVEGPLPERDTVQLTLPLRPHHVQARVVGWRLDGLHEDGLVDDDLQLTRLKQDGAGEALQAGALPPFVRVERRLLLGLTWEVRTRVRRLTPPGSAVVLEVPLLAGESVTTAALRVVDGKVLVNMGPQASEVSWQSVLTQRKVVQLEAPRKVPWIELWQLEASPIWHVEANGIPPVHPQDTAVRRPRWRPWPGEGVTLTITRPKAVAGPTLTIDRSYLTLRPGRRATQAELALRARTSRGIQQTLTLPEAAKLESVMIDGRRQPIRQDGQTVTLPLSPGSRDIVLTWRQDEGIRLAYRAPAVHLGAESVNATTAIEMPANRWTLFVGGPRLGPAVLFWSQLVVLLLIALALGRSRLTPLRTHQWMLLALGLTQVPVWAAALVAGWLLALGWRARRSPSGRAVVFDLAQLALTVLTMIALAVLFVAIQQGLLGMPEMQVAGYGSTASDLHWFSDRAAAALPQPWVVSVPLFVYRAAMLAWALWLAIALIRWLRWGWRSISAGGLWLPLRRKRDASAA